MIPLRTVCLAVVAPIAVAATIHAGAVPVAHTESDDIALALSAAPPSFASDADVYTLQDGILRKVVDRGGRLACVVSRSNPESAFPMCYDESATRSVLPVTIFRQELHAAGRSDDEIDAAVVEAIADGQLGGPERGAIVWMISSGQVIYAGERHVGQWYPHLMVYFPGATLEQFGLSEPQRGDVLLQGAGTPMAHLLVVTPHWSDDEVYADR